MKRNWLCYGEKTDSWFVADFETITTNTDYYDSTKDSIVILANSCEWSSEVHHTFTNIKDWWNYHYNLDRSQTIWFHNLTWDGDYILKYLESIGFKPNKHDTNYHYNNIETFLVQGKIFYIKVNIRKRTKFKDVRFHIIFRCSLRILNSTVATLGKSVGLAKHHENDDVLELDEKGRWRKFYDWEPKQTIQEWEDESDRSRRYLEYIKNDCLIVLKSLIDLSNSINNISFVKRHNEHELARKRCSFEPLECMTSAGLAEKLMTMSVKEYVHQNEKVGIYPLKISSSVHNYLKEYYKGGFTQINDKYNSDPNNGRYENIAPAIFIDVSSAYPYQMTMPLPYGELLANRPDGIEGVDYYNFKYIKVKSAKIKKECYACPILLNWNKFNKNEVADHRYVREMKNFECFYTSKEWNIINQFYDIEIISEMNTYMKAMPYLKEYSEELYEIKKHYALTHQSGLKQASKIVINAGYGSLGKGIEFDSKILLPKEDSEFFSQLTKREDFFIMGKREFLFKDVKNYDPEGKLIVVSAKSTWTKDEGNNKAAAAVVTSLQRCYLWELILKIGCEHFCYSDTDSILFGKLPKNKLDYLLKLTNIKEKDEKLGVWTNEYPNKNITYFAQHGAKRYMLFDENEQLIKFRYAGIKVDAKRAKDLAQQIDFNESEIYFEDAVLDKISTKSGLVLVPKDKVIKKGKI